MLDAVYQPSGGLLATAIDQIGRVLCEAVPANLSRPLGTMGHDIAVYPVGDIAAAGRNWPVNGYASGVQRRPLPHCLNSIGTPAAAH